MADSNAPRVKPHGFVAHLVRDPRRPPRVKLLKGFIGESHQPDHVRVYLDVELRRAIDVPTAGIVHVHTVPEEVHPLAPALVWVREDVKVSHGGSWLANEDPTTMATGEEGGDPTTMATGEEGTGIENPLDLVVNPFGF